MSIDELIQKHSGDLQIRNYSARTVEEYGYVLRQFHGFLEQQKITDVQSVTTATLTGFQRWLYHEPTRQGTARSVADQNKILAAVKGFFRFLKNEGYLARDPSEPVEYARQQRRLPRNVLTPREAAKIIDAIDTTTTLGYRDRTILEVFYATGIRRAELRGLHMLDVNLDDETLRVNKGKGGKDRIVPLNQIACKFLETYIKGIRPELTADHSGDVLFLSRYGRPMPGTTVGELVKKYAKLAGIKKHVTCHTWRHSCATHLVKNNANLRHVQEILGHASLETTHRYLSLTITDLKEAHRKFHPRS